MNPSTRSAPRGPGRWRGALIVDPRSRLRRHPALLDGAIATLVAGLPLVIGAVDPRQTGDRVTGADIAASLLAFVLLLCRRRFPLPVLLLAVAGSVVSFVVTKESSVLIVVATIAVYTVSSATNRVTAWVAGALTALALLIASWLTSTVSWFAPETLASIAWFGMATAAGDAVRIHRAYVKAVEERAERAERILEEEGMRRVVEERLRIARDLHDMVAHHIAVINVQAGVASHLLKSDPDAAASALAHVRQGGRSVLDELGSILRVLRRPEDVDAPVETLPTLEALDTLIASFQESGLAVEWRSSGQYRQLPDALELTGYRIVQESLTNAHKHGGGTTARLRLNYEPTELSIEVVNAGEPSPTNPTGHGIVGMQERAAAVGGTLVVGRGADGSFRVHAKLPIPAVKS